MSEDRNVVFLKERIEEAASAENHSAVKHYEELLAMLCKRMNEKGNKSND